MLCWVVGGEFSDNLDLTPFSVWAFAVVRDFHWGVRLWVRRQDVVYLSV